MEVYVDADASPVKDIIIEEARLANVPVTLVASFAHYSNEVLPEGVQTVYVDAGSDAADYRIMKLTEKGDVIVTQDYGLASLALAKGCIVLHHKGFRYTNQNIDQLLESRYLSAKARKSGKRTKGPKPLSDEDRKKFRELFRQTLK